MTAETALPPLLAPVVLRLLSQKTLRQIGAAKPHWRGDLVCWLVEPPRRWREAANCRVTAERQIDGRWLVSLWRDEWTLVGQSAPVPTELIDQAVSDLWHTATPEEVCCDHTA